MATIKLKQTGSPIRRPAAQRVILKSLGLDKMNRVVEHQDTPEIRGMVQKVRHIVTVVD